MPMSLKCMIDKWLHKGQISQEEYEAVIKKLDGHDSEIKGQIIRDVLETVKEQNEIYLAEREKQIREDTIDDFVNAYMKDEEQYDGCRECERNDDYCCIQCFRDRFLKQLKGTENE